MTKLRLPRPTIDFVHSRGRSFGNLYNADKMRKFAEKAVLAEREACAKVCDAVLNEDGNWTPIGHRFAAAIRARGQA